MTARATTAPYKILYASDLHFMGERSLPLAAQVLGSIQETRPDVVLLGGDMVDIPGGLGPLSWLIKEASSLSPVWAIRGNHDRLIPESKLKVSIESSGGHWLEGQSFIAARPNGLQIKVYGYLHSPSPLMTANDFPVLCAHHPDIFPAAAARFYSLVLAGHLHGCQCVLWRKDNRLYPGAWFYKWNGLRFQQGNTSMVVSRGVSDTLPIRWNCPREVLLCEIY